MRKSMCGGALVFVALLASGCADPAADKPKATVANVAPDKSSPPPAAAEKLTFTQETSKIDFVASKVTKSHSGSFKQFSGNIDLVPNNLADSRVTIEIQTDSVETDDPGLTKHLKTPDFFDVAKNPKATFTSTKIEPAGSTYNVTGNFDLHGVQKSITFPATIQVASDSVSVTAEFSINRKDFGIVYAGKADDLIRDGVVIRLNLKAPRK